jgi:hypothetical protein
MGFRPMRVGKMGVAMDRGGFMAKLAKTNVK